MMLKREAPKDAPDSVNTMIDIINFVKGLSKTDFGALGLLRRAFLQCSIGIEAATKKRLITRQIASCDMGLAMSTIAPSRVYTYRGCAKFINRRSMITRDVDLGAHLTHYQWQYCETEKRHINLCIYCGVFFASLQKVHELFLEVRQYHLRRWEGGMVYFDIENKRNRRRDCCGCDGRVRGVRVHSTYSASLANLSTRQH